MLFDAPVEILDMRKCSLTSATRQLTRTASRGVIDAMNTMNSVLSSSRSDLPNAAPSTPNEVPIRRPAPFLRHQSSPQFLFKKSQSLDSSTPPVEDRTTKPSPFPRKSVPSASFF